jgi:predicted nuclease of predicted toxin-antitoxin system
MKLKLDENLGASILHLFREGGHDVENLRAEGLAGAADQQVIESCDRERHCLVTLDLDFSNPLRFPPADYAGIVVLRLPRRPSHENLDAACRTLLAALTEQSPAGRLWIIEIGRLREYQPGKSETES